MIEGPFYEGNVSCTVVLIPSTNLTGYNQIVTNTDYTPPDCLSDASVAVIELSGSVGPGVQFDRYGAFWLGGVELLRTSTPEPNDVRTISWRAKRDVTEYMSIFNNSRNATLSIPNQVTDVYDGVLLVNVTLTLYSATEGKEDIGSSASLVIGLETKQSWAAMKSPSHTSFDLPVRNAHRIILEVFASAHGCDEFWYSNMPGNATSCGAGGTFREINVKVDGTLAGIALPFPVVYSGGLNPLAWRPLACPASFEIPPYRFDLTPFAGIFNDGHRHNVTASVDGENEWYISPVLLVWTDQRFQSVPGELVSVTETPLALNEQNFTTVGHHAVSIVGNIFVDSLVTTNVSYHVSLINTNRPIESRSTSYQSTRANMSSHMKVTRSSPTKTTTIGFWSESPLSVDLLQADDYIDASISLARRNVLRVNDDLPLMWTAAVNSSATFTGKSKGGSDEGFATTRASFQVVLDGHEGSQCYAANATAMNGALNTSTISILPCAFPTYVRYCGLEVCADLSHAI